jgi:hypothetical protein
MEKCADYSFLQQEMEKLQDSLTLLREENRVLLSDLHESTAQVARQDHVNKELEEKSLKVIELHTQVELLAN